MEAGKKGTEPFMNFHLSGAPKLHKTPEDDLLDILVAI